jgi:hypothetical protein
MFEARTSIDVMGLNEPGIRRRFSLMRGHQNQLWWDLPAADSSRPHREIDSLPVAEFETDLAELTEPPGVEERNNQAVRELSPGERRKMERIAALLRHPAPPARRADHRPRRRGPCGDPEVPAGLPPPPGGDDAPDEPPHVGTSRLTATGSW